MSAIFELLVSKKFFRWSGSKPLVFYGIHQETFFPVVFLLLMMHYYMIKQ